VIRSRNHAFSNSVAVKSNNTSYYHIMPRVFSSVKEAWHGVLSGSVVPNARRRVSCSAIVSGCPTSTGTGFRQGETQATALGMESVEENGEEEANLFECRVFVKQSDDEKDSEEIDLSAFSDEDIRKLKKDDPFLYYSIPGFRRRSYRFDDEEEDDDRTVLRSQSVPRRSSLPAEMLAAADMRHDQTQHQIQVLPALEEPSSRRRDLVVRRNRRCSTEAHPTLVCDELLRELQELEDGGLDGEDVLELLDRDLGI